MRFSYTSGSRPLEGYTIKRGIGIGGFGEVYFALNDAGKEVALKKIQRNLDIELRGVRHCLNLKHVNLISLWDIRMSQAGESWVVMEYVPGPSLRDVIEAHQTGMPEPQIKRWFASTCSGVAYLHEHGIVHRDLKPGNIFLDQDEQVIKIGDYGLSKFISHSRRSRQTESVGTFHYMAPEIGKGEYGKEIDIYAMGIILYEMLTGETPFEGESTQEIIMKHLTMDPDVEPLPLAYRRVISKSLRKDPQKRYRNISEMVRELPWPEIAAHPEHIIGRHSVGPIRIDGHHDPQTISTADHPGSPTHAPYNVPADESIVDAEIVAKLPPVIIDGREIVQKDSQGVGPSGEPTEITFGPLTDSSHRPNEPASRSDTPAHTDIHFISDHRPPTDAAAPLNSITGQGTDLVPLVANRSTELGANSADVVQTKPLQAAAGSASHAKLPASNSLDPTPGVPFENAELTANPGSGRETLVANTTSAVAHPSLPVQDFGSQSGFADLLRWWNQATFAIPIRLFLMVGIGLLLIRNPAWLLPAIALLVVIHLGFQICQQFLLRRRGGAKREAALELNTLRTRSVRSWLASQPTTDRATELVGSMLMGAIGAIVISLLGLAVGRVPSDALEMWAVFTWQSLICVASVWVILAVTKGWSLKSVDFSSIATGDFWIRLAIMLLVGAAMGLIAFFSAGSFEIDLVRVASEDIAAQPTRGWVLDLMPKFPAMILAFAGLFALAFFGHQTDRLRRTRLSLRMVVACLAAAVLLSHLLNVPLTVLCILATVVSVTVQLASPWMHPDEQLEICRSQE